MTLAVAKNKWKKLKKLLGNRGVEATIIGTFTKSGRCVVRYNKKTIMDISMKFLHDGLPELEQKSRALDVQFENPNLPRVADLSGILTDMMGRLNVASYAFISMQFDHEVQATSVTKPLQGIGRVNSDATVMRPILSSDSGVALTQALYPSYSNVDPYCMAACSIDTAIRNAVAAGADPQKIALLDNFCWCSAKDDTRLWQLKKAAEACFDYAVSYGTPFISGKDSMFNDFSGFDAKGKPIKISIPPTLLVSAIGLLQDVRKAITLDVKEAGDLVYLLGETHEEMGASEYFSYLKSRQKTDAIGVTVPAVDATKNKRLYKKLASAIRRGLVASAISVHRGGLGVALARSALGGRLGLHISLQGIKGRVGRDDSAMFSESQGRILVTIDPKKRKQFERLLHGSAYKKLGEVTQKPVVTVGGLQGNKIVDVPLGALEKSYMSRFAGY